MADSELPAPGSVADLTSRAVDVTPIDLDALLAPNRPTAPIPVTLRGKVYRVRAELPIGVTLAAVKLQDDTVPAQQKVEGLLDVCEMMVVDEDAVAFHDAARHELTVDDLLGFVQHVMERVVARPTGESSGPASKP